MGILLEYIRSTESVTVQRHKTVVFYYHGIGAQSCDYVLHEHKIAHHCIIHVNWKDYPLPSASVHCVVHWNAIGMPLPDPVYTRIPLGSGRIFAGYTAPLKQSTTILTSLKWQDGSTYSSKRTGTYWTRNGTTKLLGVCIECLGYHCLYFLDTLLYQPYTALDKSL